jgi:hypothetical protein
VLVPLLVVAGMLLWVAIPALAATPRVGKWKGTASIVVAPGAAYVTPVTFSIFRATDGRKRVKEFTLGSLKATHCTGAEKSFGTWGFKATVKPRVIDGKFSFKQTTGGGTTKTLKVTGRFTTRRKAQGTVTLTASKSGSTCTTGKSYWKAALQ